MVGYMVLKCGGRVSQGWRELAEKNELSQELLTRFKANPASKSHVPHSVRDAVQIEVGMLYDEHHGPRQAKLNGAHLSRDWSGVLPMDWLCADDVTWPVYFYVEDASSKSGFALMRGQCLLIIDTGSTRILGHALLPERNYNALAIRTLITKICEEHGLPRKGFYFERGIWESSKILTGDAKADTHSWGEVEIGLRSLGLLFTHARLPRGKPVERVIGALQNFMEGEPGYVGRNEMVEKFERVQRQKLEVERGEVHPSKHFYSMDQWEARLGEIYEKYNYERQDGKMTGGLTPNAKFEKGVFTNTPLIKFDAQTRYLLAHHMRPIRVTPNGITLKFGKQTFNYRNAQTGELRGQTVLAWFNPETPETLTVTDMNRENPFCVIRSQDIPAMSASPELIAQEMEKINAHNKYAKYRYRTVKALVGNFRRNVVDAQTAELGEQIEQQRVQAQANDKQQKSTMAKARRAYKNLGGIVPDAALNRPDAVKDAEELTRFLQENTNE